MMGNHVLVVDDQGGLERSVREMLPILLGRTVRCSHAQTGSRARAIASENGDLDLLIVERRLPDTDGLDLIAALRALCPRAEGIIVSVDGAIDDGAEVLTRGVFAHLKRPFAPATLAQSAQAALTKVELLRERELLRGELELSERRQREIVEALPAFVLATDEQRRILVWNNRLETVTGRWRSEMLGTDASELIGDGGDRRLVTKDGGQRLVRWQLTEVRDADGHPIVYALGTDVTDERAMLQRTLRAERLAAVGTLATGLAHEVRNPLNSATLQLQVLRRRLERLDPDGQQLVPIVDTVDDEIRRLDRLVNDFLAFSRPHPLRPETTSLSRVLTGVADEMRREADAVGISLRLELDSPLEPVEADVERLRQVLLNLTKNGIEAMPGGGTLTIRARAADAEGFVSIQVEDTGVGIPEDTPIFDAFFTTKQNGTGLGLAIVHRIIDEHGGSVHFESRPGSTRFTIRLLASTQGTGQNGKL